MIHHSHRDYVTSQNTQIYIYIFLCICTFFKRYIKPIYMFMALLSKKKKQKLKKIIL